MKLLVILFLIKLVARIDIFMVNIVNTKCSNARLFEKNSMCNEKRQHKKKLFNLCPLINLQISKKKITKIGAGSTIFHISNLKLLE